jgi:hypothetical protein
MVASVRLNTRCRYGGTGSNWHQAGIGASKWRLLSANVILDHRSLTRRVCEVTTNMAAMCHISLGLLGGRAKVDHHNANWRLLS